MHAKQKLQKVEQRRAILYTLGEGVCPLWVIVQVIISCTSWVRSWATTDCNMGYHHNYSVCRNVRSYYPGDLPAIIEVANHHLVEQKVIRMWNTDMNIAWYVLFHPYNWNLIQDFTGSQQQTALSHTLLPSVEKTVFPLIGLSSHHSRGTMFTMGSSSLPCSRIVGSITQFWQCLMIVSMLTGSRRQSAKIHASSFMDNLKFYMHVTSVSACIPSKENVDWFTLTIHDTKLLSYSCLCGSNGWHHNQTSKVCNGWMQVTIGNSIGSILFWA